MKKTLGIIAMLLIVAMLSVVFVSCKPGPEEPAPDQPAPDQPTHLYMKMNQPKAKPSGDYYFTGVMDGEYLATSLDFAEAKEVFKEEVEDGFKLYVMVTNEEGTEVKKYINIIDLESDEAKKSKVRPILDETGCVFFIHPEFEVLSTKIIARNNVDGVVQPAAETVFYLGTYNKYKTINFSNIYFIESKPEDKGVGQFYAELVPAPAPEA